MRGPSEPTFTFIDLFAGIGGIRLGLERAGGECVYSVEIDRHARQTYECNFGRVDHEKTPALVDGVVRGIGTTTSWSQSTTPGIRSSPSLVIAMSGGG